MWPVRERGSSRSSVAGAPSYTELVERQVVLLYSRIVLVLFLMGALVWAAVTAVRLGAGVIADGWFLLLAVGGVALALTVLALLSQLIEWARRRG